ncbi:hypothetical protein HYU11_01290 [Candidatus Woesearchaeota archaeon]|nr:hypothetical protein [Candidatus Woesearchaeota archaeon]
MKIANSIKISVFAKEDENEAAIEEKLRELTSLDLEKEKINVKKQTATGFNEKKIRIMEIVLEKDRHIKAFIGFLKENLGEKQKEILLRQKESRLDNNLNFFIRLDKEKLLNNEFWITDSGNCFHIKANIAAFPKKKEKAVEIIKSIFTGHGFRDNRYMQT